MEETGKGREEGSRPSVPWVQPFDHDVKFGADGPTRILCLPSGYIFFYLEIFSFFGIIPNNFVFARIRNKQKNRRVGCCW